MKNNFPTKKINKAILLIILILIIVYEIIVNMSYIINRKKIDKAFVDVFDLSDKYIEELPSIDSRFNQIIEYDVLSWKFKLFISRDEYENAKTAEDYLRLIKKINWAPFNFHNPKLTGNEHYSTKHSFKTPLMNSIRFEEGSSIGCLYNWDVDVNVFTGKAEVMWLHIDYSYWIGGVKTKG